MALVKKAGVLQQPKACWSADPKINPSAVHMLWASVIIEDIDALATVVGMIGVELSSGSKKINLNEFLTEKLSILGALPPNPEKSGWLKVKIISASEILKLPIEPHVP
ncbi:MAG: hypothetical protein KKG47_05415 [Proteobacteria bacterium]|nr:hypothetical protein [Pseudomonadota bacterium]MBU1736915.1 hypothetical protein [Pseudomonadota bacterium]